MIHRYAYKTIEYLDNRVLRPLIESLPYIDEDVAIAVLPDHPTPCRLRTHTSNAVRFLLYYKGIEADNVESFDEFSVKDGGYNHLVGDEFIKNLITKY